MGQVSHTFLEEHSLSEDGLLALLPLRILQLLWTIVTLYSEGEKKMALVELLLCAMCFLSVKTFNPQTNAAWQIQSPFLQMRNVRFIRVKQFAEIIAPDILFQWVRVRVQKELEKMLTQTNYRLLFEKTLATEFIQGQVHSYW